MLHLLQKDCRPELITRSIECNQNGNLQPLKDEYERLSEQVAHQCSSMLETQPLAGNWFVSSVKDIRHFLSLWRQQLQELLEGELPHDLDLGLDMPTFAVVGPYRVGVSRAALYHLRHVSKELATAEALCGHSQDSPKRSLKQASPSLIYYLKVARAGLKKQRTSVIQVKDSSLFTDYIEFKVQSGRAGKPKTFRDTLLYFDSLQNRMERLTRMDFSQLSLPPEINAQLKLRCEILRVIPVWRRGFNQLYFSPGVTQEQSSICQHACEFLGSWDQLLREELTRMSEWKSRQTAPGETSKWIQWFQRCKQEVDFNKHTDTEKAASALLDEVEQQKRLQDKQKTAKRKPKVAKSDAQTYMESLLTCPLTKCRMHDPVILADGHSYERSAAEVWLQHSNCSPVTGETLLHDRIVKNHAAQLLAETL